MTRLSPHAPLDRLTLRPLPAPDIDVASLSLDERKLLAGSWYGRSEGEFRTAYTFRYLAETLAAGGARELAATALVAIDDELRHSELCRRVGSIFLGRELPTPPPWRFQLPYHEGASPTLLRSLHVVGQCCVNETTAGAFLELCLEQAGPELIRAVMRELLTDEISHARLGWAWVAALPTEEREALAPWVATLIDANWTSWRDRPPQAGSPSLRAHGMPSNAELDEALLAAVRDLILPGFASLGVDTRGGERWLATVAGP